MSQRTSRVAATLALPLLAACAAGDNPAHTGAQVEVDTLGDTVVVRTLAGSEWGQGAALVEELSIGMLEGPEEYIFGQISSVAAAPDGSVYVLDGQVPVLRRYGPDGSFVAQIGREGGGPGEYKQPTDLAVLPDGRVVISDPGNSRVSVFSPESEALESWPIPGGFFTTDQLQTDRDGNVYVQIIAERHDDGTFTSGYMRVGPEGTPADTLRVPDPGVETPRLIARSVSEDGRSRGMSWRSVPFWPTPTWTFSPNGHFVVGLGERYSLDARLPGGKVLRIERTWQPVPVEPDERANEEERVVASMRGTEPKWSWSGPAIPDTKPPFRSIRAGADGRIWVRLHQPAARIEEPEEETTGRPGRPVIPVLRWREPVVFDVFEADGRYLGRLELPDRAELAHAEGDVVWAVVRDELDVQRLVRYRIVPGA